MEYMYAFLILGGLIVLLGLYNKFSEKRELEKLKEENQKKLDYHKRPNSPTFYERNIK